MNARARAYAEQRRLGAELAKRAMAAAQSSFARRHPPAHGRNNDRDDDRIGVRLQREAQREAQRIDRRVAGLGDDQDADDHDPAQQATAHAIGGLGGVGRLVALWILAGFVWGSLII